jgi:hypothetical protein
VRPLAISAALALCWLFFGIVALHDYGLGIDSPALFYAGDRSVFGLRHPGTPGVFDLNAPEPPGFQTPYGRNPAWDDPMHYPGLPGLVAAFSNQLFHVRLARLSDLDAHQLGLVLLHVIGLFFFTFYGCRLLGNLAGASAGVALALFPTAIEQAFTNPKDWPCALYYGAGVLAFGFAIRSGKGRHVLASAVLLGISLGAKANTGFAVVTILLYSPIAWFLLYRRQKPLPASFIAAFAAAPLVSFAVFFISWPWLYEGPLLTWVEHITDYVQFVTAFGHGVRPTFTVYPFKAIAVQSPPLILVCALAYALLGWRRVTRIERAAWWLLVCWLGVIVIRIAAPHSNFYDATRHFLEYVPALCAMAGAGASMMVGFVRARMPRLVHPATAAVAAACALTSLVLPVVLYHPYELAYFNFLVGGLGGAQRSHVLSEPPPQDRRARGTEGDYWFSSVRIADRDLSHLMKPGETIAWCGAWPWQIVQDWPVGTPPPPWATSDRSDYLLVGTRGCDSEIQELESDRFRRPLLIEERRGGGVIYRIYGPLYRWDS